MIGCLIVLLLACLVFGKAAVGSFLGTTILAVGGLLLLAVTVEVASRCYSGIVRAARQRKNHTGAPWNK